MSLFLHRIGILKPAPTPFTTDWKNAGTGENIDAGERDWSNPGNITSSDDSRATCNTDENNNPSNYLRATNFGFSTSDVASGATILGIEIEIEWHSNDGQTNIFHAELVLDGSQVGDDLNDDFVLPTSDDTRIYGGSDEDWNANLTDSDVRDSTFGFQLRVESTGNDITRVDRIRARIHGEA